MALKFYYLSGSPFAWKVWLALEHKQIRHELTLLSADRGDLKMADYLAINPRGKVPSIVHGDFSLYESAAILEYLEEAFPDSGAPLWPRHSRLRALGRRMAAETEAYLYPPVRRLVEQLVLRRDGPPDETVLTEARRSVAENLELLARTVQGSFLLGEDPSAADFALYPLTAILMRLNGRHPDLGLAFTLPEALSLWRARMESLPFFQATWPPHWQA